MHAARPHDLAQELRRRLFAGSRFEAPQAQGMRCVTELWAYVTSCDRSLRTYGQPSFAARVELLRSLANYTEAPASPRAAAVAEPETEVVNRERRSNAGVPAERLEPQ